ncbi:uncharacterized protein BX664DRAFT_358539 [Halteromyces radiatus]|uniref:uncharacterized protein n=1 Tax=Halteromyces radiatus TaxID=101107 RepID=UPI00221FEC77|nr:uncharacterized protein BX664DRAFT_358539 [Halteromyces radiatus]KAI8088919.1 hypothetical protein BX664DRAFT_358539 [Halteromyces radiatus]
MKNLSLIALFALVATSMAAPSRRDTGDACQQASTATCSNDYQVTKDCCAATQGKPIFFDEWAHKCTHPFGGLNWDKFTACCTSRVPAEGIKDPKEGRQENH